MTTMIECTEGHYEVQKVSYGEAYIWCPESVVVECKCGKRATHKRADLISRKMSACECGEDDMAGIREEVALELVEDEDYEAKHHPWRYWHPSADSGILD